MAIGKLPKRNNNSSNEMNEKKAQAFIQKETSTSSEDMSTKNSKIPIMIRFDAHLLKRVEVTAKKRGINRSALIQFLVSRAIDDGDI